VSLPAVDAIFLDRIMELRGGEKLLARIVCEPGDGCWRIPTQRRDRYPQAVVGGIHARLHVLAYELTRGPLGERYALHSCDDRCPPGDVTYRSCLRPSHVWAGTQLDNMRDASAKGRTARGAEHGAKVSAAANHGDDHWTHRMTELLPWGEKSHFAKYAANDVERVCAMRASGMTLPQIVEATGISKSQVSRMYRGETWRHMNPANSNAREAS
jgi:hypothetical protein